MSATDLPPAVPRLMTAQELAARWRVPASHVYRLTREGRVPAVQLGRYYRYRLDVIERFELGDQPAPPTTKERA